jgi:hypothetical protein
MVKVTDADRDLFILVSGFSLDSQFAAHVKKNAAYTWEVQQIARHRIAGVKAALEKAAEEVEVRWGHIATPELRDAIRNIDPEECE